MNIHQFKNLKKESTHSKNNLIISYGSNGTAESIYSDNIWNFHDQLKNKILGRKVFNFNNLIMDNNNLLIDNITLLNELKDYFYIQINSGVKLNSVINNSTAIFTFINFIKTVLNKNSLTEIVSSDFYLYVDFLKIKYQGYSVSFITTLLTSVSILGKYRQNLPYRINFIPFEGLSIKKIISKNSNFIAKKQTDIIPDELWRNIINVSSKQLYTYLNNIKLEREIIQDCNEYYFSNPLNKHRYFGKKFNEKYSAYDGVYKTSDTHFWYIYNTTIACSIIIQAFTGMRISELLAIKINPIISEKIIIEGKEEEILKIKSKTFKYENEEMFKPELGRETTWLCPPIVKDAINALQTITSQRRDMYNYFLNNHLFKDKHMAYKENKDYLHLYCRFSKSSRISLTGDISNKYIPFLNSKGIDTKEIKLSSHCFRRTLARFFARSLLKIPIDVLQDQMKHYSKDITHYYMKEDLKADSSFVELIEGYIDNRDISKEENKKLLFAKISDKIGHSIMSANNVDELIAYSNGREIELVNKYMVSLDKNNNELSAIECLTCDGVLILPDLHLDFWKDMLNVYEDVHSFEPDNIWYKKEMIMVKNLVATLESGNAYQTRGIE